MISLDAIAAAIQQGADAAARTTQPGATFRGAMPEAIAAGYHAQTVGYHLFIAAFVDAIPTGGVTTDALGGGRHPLIAQPDAMPGAHPAAHPVPRRTPPMRTPIRPPSSPTYCVPCFDPGPAPSADDLIAAQETLEAYDGREEDIPRDPALARTFAAQEDPIGDLLGEDADPEECNDTRALTFEHAHALLIEGYTLTAPAIHNLPEATYRIDSDSVGDDDPAYLIDGYPVDHDTFAAALAADCADDQ